MAKTKTELARRALEELGLLDINTDPDGVTQGFIFGRYDTKYEQLLDKGFVYWANTDNTTEEIPEAVFDALGMILAGEMAPTFGREVPARYDDKGRARPINVLGMIELRRLTETKSSRVPLQASSF